MDDRIEIPQIEVPDEVRQVDLPEIGETTPHPKPDSPQAERGSASYVEGDAAQESERPIGFFTP
ncbi:hypothetical protein [Brevibacillus brevis]|uniref:Uncharacterized protein n=1 Tax=Brevibacillus brevis TaxID=1393 RepID=A0ABY9T208_BREBE|nr:hypothetical protein [Brevibacillus brevis]WNC14138.1 hypothetical protein RGB73_26225 [Brevibacillus brevis]